MYKSKLGSAGQTVFRCSPGSGYVWQHLCLECSAWGLCALWKSLTELLFLRVFALKVPMFGLLVFQKGLKCTWLLRSDFRRVVKENSIYSSVSRWTSIKSALMSCEVCSSSIAFVWRVKSLSHQCLNGLGNAPRMVCVIWAGSSTWTLQAFD